MVVPSGAAAVTVPLTPIVKEASPSPAEMTVVPPGVTVSVHFSINCIEEAPLKSKLFMRPAPLLNDDGPEGSSENTTPAGSEYCSSLPAVTMAPSKDFQVSCAFKPNSMDPEFPSGMRNTPSGDILNSKFAQSLDFNSATKLVAPSKFFQFSTGTFVDVPSAPINSAEFFVVAIDEPSSNVNLVTDPSGEYVWEIPTPSAVTAYATPPLSAIEAP